MLSFFTSEQKTDDAVHYPTKFLNSLNPAGLSSHELQIKVGVLPNLNSPRLCNDARLRVIGLQNNSIEATIWAGPASGEVV